MLALVNEHFEVPLGQTIFGQKNLGKNNEMPQWLRTSCIPSENMSEMREECCQTKLAKAVYWIFNFFLQLLPGDSVHMLFHNE